MSGFWNRFFRKNTTGTPRKGELHHRIALITGIQPKDLSLYELAFRHSSASKKVENAEWTNNERLEFLGDAILGAIIAEYLYDRYPEKNEGYLTSMRAKMVSRKNLNVIAEKLNLAPLVISKLDHQKPARSLLGDVFEALIGAIYLDNGLESARQFITQKVIEDHTEFTQLEKQVVSFKSAFIEYAQGEKLKHEFRLEDKWGQNHNLTFKIGLYLNSQRIAEGCGTSKKRAEESAAESACTELKITM